MASKDPPSGLHTHLGYWLRLVSNAVSQDFARKVDTEGVTVAEWVILRMLYDVARMAPSALAERLAVTKGAVSKLAERLMKKGLLERKANSDDKRAHTLALTVKGRRLVPRLAALADQNDAAFFDALDRRERHQLEQLVRKIVSERKLTNVPID